MIKRFHDKKRSYYIIKVYQGEHLLGFIHKKSVNPEAGKKTVFLNTPQGESKMFNMDKNKIFSSKIYAKQYVEKCKKEKNNKLFYEIMTIIQAGYRFSPDGKCVMLNSTYM